MLTILFFITAMGNNLDLALKICNNVMAHVVAPTLGKDRTHTLSTTFTFTPIQSQQSPVTVTSSATQPPPTPPASPIPTPPDSPVHCTQSCCRPEQTLQPSTSRGTPLPSTSRGYRPTSPTYIQTGRNRVRPYYHRPATPYRRTDTSTTWHKPTIGEHLLQELRPEDRGVLIDEMEVIDLPVVRSRAYDFVPSDTEEEESSQCITCVKRAPRIMFACRHIVYCLICVQRLEYRFYIENDAKALDCPMCRKRIPYFRVFLP